VDRDRDERGTYGGGMAVHGRTMRRLRKAVSILAGLVALIAIAVYFIFQLPEFGGRFEGKRLERMRRSPEFIGGRFENTPPQKTDPSLLKIYKLYSQGQIRKPQFEIPIIKLDPSSLGAPASQGLKAIWFGHATVLVEIEGLRIMTDPVLSNVLSPVPFIYGVKRFHPPPVVLQDLSHINAVLISHDHFDHLDMKTIQHLASQGTHFYMGLGVGAHLERWGVSLAQIHEMDWWESVEVKGVKIVCTPARHYSGRKKMDNSTLWTSWVVKGSDHSVYFSGDTGYADHFREIRKRFGDMDLTLMKVGAYGETWLDIHMDPESAVQAHLDLGGKILLPVHWATFDLSYHAWDEPILRTLSAAKDKGVHVITPRVGETFQFGQPFQNIEWYKR
jgi:L-ascorbate metabolism protein UlaG (beta-lactamase superfamily)